MTASFQQRELGFDDFLPMPEAPSPDDCPDPRLAVERLEGPAQYHMKGMLDTVWPIDFRPTDLGRYEKGAILDPHQTIWTRIGEPLPDDPAIHRAALLYLSDLSLLETALGAHGRTIHDNRIQVASLDHALWFHRSARTDQWLLYVQDSPSASGARGLVRGLLYARDGALIATVAQEGLIRQRHAK
jgi:acyl-CoA thioesterase-2